MTISRLRTIIGQGIPRDIYRWHYIKQDWPFLCCAQYTCNMMSWVRKASLECAVNNSINNIRHSLAPRATLPGRESVTEMRSRGQTRVRKWGERQDARSLGGAGRGVAFQGRNPSVCVLKGKGAAAARGGVRPSSGIPVKCHMLCVCGMSAGMARLTLNATCLLTFSRKTERRETLQMLASHRGPEVKITIMEAAANTEQNGSFKVLSWPLSQSGSLGHRTLFL